jgi:hypothetical protein
MKGPFTVLDDAVAAQDAVTVHHRQAGDKPTS